MGRSRLCRGIERGRAVPFFGHLIGTGIGAEHAGVQRRSITARHRDSALRRRDAHHATRAARRRQRRTTAQGREQGQGARQARPKKAQRPRDGRRAAAPRPGESRKKHPNANGRTAITQKINFVQSTSVSGDCTKCIFCVVAPSIALFAVAIG